MGQLDPGNLSAGPEGTLATDNPTHQERIIGEIDQMPSQWGQE